MIGLDYFDDFGFRAAEAKKTCGSRIAPCILWKIGPTAKISAATAGRVNPLPRRSGARDF
jgi:hypothetical protein